MAFRYSDSHNHSPPSLRIFLAIHPFLHHTMTSKTVHLHLPLHLVFPPPPLTTLNFSRPTTLSSQHFSRIPHHQSFLSQSTHYSTTHHSNISQPRTLNIASIKATPQLHSPSTFGPLMSMSTMNFLKNVYNHFACQTHSSPCSMSNHSTPHLLANSHFLLHVDPISVTMNYVPPYLLSHFSSSLTTQPFDTYSNKHTKNSSTSQKSTLPASANSSSRFAQPLPLSSPSSHNSFSPPTLPLRSTFPSPSSHPHPKSNPSSGPFSAYPSKQIPLRVTNSSTPYPVY